MKFSIRFFVSLFAALIAITGFSINALAQSNRGGISGTVTDPTGAVVPGASVTITNMGTNQKTKLTTSAAGSFSASSLEPVLYSVTVEAPGFKKSILSSVKVDTATVTTANVALEAGGIDNVVDITGSAPLLNAVSGTTTHTIVERQIQDVPLNNRSVLDLAVTSPNVSGDAGSEDPDVTSGQPVPGFNLSLNGGRPGSTSILADGVNNTGVGIARTVVSFTPETVQEFTVQTSAYSAEFGQTGGGVINVTTKSGTNSFNGVALWYHRNPATNASQFRTGAGPRPPLSLRYNQVSVSAGGPVFLPKFGEGGKPFYDGRNKTFFFFAYEPRFRTDFVTTTTLLPSAAERSGDFSNLVRTTSGWLPASVAARFNQASVGGITDIFRQFNKDASGRLVPITLGTGQLYPQFPGNKIPAEYIDPIAVNLLQYMPPAGDFFIDDAGLVRNYVVNRFVKQDETRYTIRLDHSINQSNKINFRYTTTPTVGVRGFGSDVNGNSAAYGDAKQILIGDNHIFSPTIINEFRVNYTRGVFSEDFSPEFSIKDGRNLATELGLPSLTAGGLPLFQVSGDGGYNAFTDVGSSGSTNNYNVEERFNINNIVYWTRGNMTWKFGIDLSHARLNVVPFFGASGGRWEFRMLNTSNNRASNSNPNGGNPFASLLTGVVNQVQVRPLLIDYNYRWNSYAGFVQNDWRVSPNLTLNLGLRYSLQMPRTEKHNLQGVFRPDLAQNVTLTETQRRAIATGIGIAATAPIPAFVPTTAAIPPFAFSGMGGRSRYIVDPDYSGIEPRIGFAWSPRSISYFERTSAVIRGGYGISHAPLTGNNRAPSPDFGGFVPVPTTATGSSGTADTAQPVRLTSNPPKFSGKPLSEALGITPDGLVFMNSIVVPGFADFPGTGSNKVPYSQNWNLAFAFEPLRNTVVEFAYVGNRGTHLYLPFVNLNPRDIDFVEFLEGSNLNADTVFNDPLGRQTLLNSTVTVPRGSVLSPYFGFSVLNRFYDPSANSIRHAAYVDMRRRVANGLTFTANYTFGRSIDDASDASPDTRVITEVGQTQGHVSYGAPRKSDRALSTFDITHNFSSTFIWDVPVGRRRSYMNTLPGAVDAVIGGWSFSGVYRIQGGTPLLPFITDTNRLGGTNRFIRPDLVNGVSLRNPLWTRDCPFGVKSDNTPCEPYVNPAAFKRPAKGSLGSASRTLNVRAPTAEYFDFSIQKNFPFPFNDNEGRRRINFRVDFINVFNHPNFRLSNSSGGPGFTTTVPNEALVTQAEFNTWLAANPGSTVTLTQVNNLITSSRLPNGSLPLDFFSVPVPEGFSSKVANSFNIGTIDGLKLYRVRQAYDTNWGQLRALPQPRYIQFGIRIFF